jgi:two-component sensor histidine kinase
MIIAELFQNSLKYGKPDKGKAKIRLELSLEEGAYTLKYQDNGPGIPPERQNSEGLGSQLLQAFAMQLNGVLKYEESQDPGVHYSLQFPEG